VLIAATGGTERHSLVLDHALRPMFSYLHALVSPTGVYAATSDFGADRSGAALSERIGSAAGDFAHLVRVSGPRPHPGQFADELTEIQGLLTGTR
jgi:FMN reductase